MHRETSARVISCFKQVIATLDTLTTKKHDEDAKGVRVQMLLPMSILKLLLVAEVLVPINFCFLQMRSLNYSLIILKFQQVTKLHKIKENLPNYDAVDVIEIFPVGLRFAEVF